MESIDFLSKLKVKDTHKVALQDANTKLLWVDFIERVHAVSSFIFHSYPNCRRIAWMLPSNVDTAVVFFSTLQLGVLSVPISTQASVSEIEYYLQDSECQLFITEDSRVSSISHVCEKLGIPILSVSDIKVQVLDYPVSFDLYAPILLIYTSGTTSKPKGVIHTYHSIFSQVESLGLAWAWSSEDTILNVLPLHHVHGLINMLFCAIYHGASCELRLFDPSDVVTHISKGTITLFMAVPTIYHRLVKYLENCTLDTQVKFYESCRNAVRLMVSGSAALPVPLFESVQKYTGHTLLERYGMSEIGMALSNPYLSERKAGSVGVPLPGVSVRLDLDEEGNSSESIGEIQVKGNTLFVGYLGKEDAYKQSFTEDGWFKTGDIAYKDTEGYYFIMGRASQDIIKSGGYKISALEIESVLLGYVGITECAVIGIREEEWGERVVAVLVCTHSIDVNDLTIYLKERIAPYKIPKEYFFLDSLPRNAMGKCIKKELPQVLLERGFINSL